MRWLVLPIFLVFAGCETASTNAPQQTAPVAQSKTKNISHAEATRRIASVKARVEPVAERECRQRTQLGTNCNFDISVDTRTELPPNAYQTVNKTGRPLIVFTTALIAQAGNTDELAFVMGHEAAHHVRGHLTRQQQDAFAGAALGAILVGLAGGNGEAIDMAVNVGADIGARSFSKNYELEADALGTVIAHKAGYNPVRGAEFFNRIPDPGDQFLGTHPPNRARQKIVRETAAKL
ncbi:M48 family metalloprotease [Shimia abyssi]|uniref:Peptidase M48-like protein n=1 Tax=Shimia abyssi TaxID=1662395 RepID=A0A2P8FJN8_9RHOB|nr:M48 family metalloprotease [Shimia abyssi]PSL21941.1 peptidase M48-like protein [Shimia abyssi]